MRNERGQFVKGDPEIIERNKSLKQRLAVSVANKGKKRIKPSWNKGLKGWGKNYKNVGFKKGSNLGKIRLGMKATYTTIEKQRLSHIGKNIGEKHPNWKGGITLLVEKIRKCFKSRQWRSDVFTRDNYVCQDCGKRGGNLEAHHIKQFSKIIEEYQIKILEQALNCEELWNINNGQTLCQECHNKTKGYNGE